MSERTSGGKVFLLVDALTCFFLTPALSGCGPQNEAAKEFQEKHKKEVGRLKDMDLSQ